MKSDCNALATWALWVVAGLFGSVIVACRSADTRDEEQAAPPLRVAIATDAPPLAFKTEGRFTGVEPDLARALGRELGRPVEFVEVGRASLAEELLRGSADIIMSGYSVSRVRALRVAYTEPYHGNALLPLCRVADREAFDTVEEIRATKRTVGAPRETTADVWIQRNCPDARRQLTGSPDGGAFELNRRRLDCFIYDAHTIAWLAAQHEAELTVPTLEPLAVEDLAWAVRRDDRQLLDAANLALAKWRKDGTLERILRRWLTYYDVSKEWKAPAVEAGS